MRKAVTSSALMSPVVRPRLSRSVSEPRMLDSGLIEASAFLLPEEMEVCPVARLSTEAFVLFGKDDTEDLVVGVDSDPLECDVVASLFELLRLAWVSRLSLETSGRFCVEASGPSVGSMLTILMP